MVLSYIFNHWSLIWWSVKITVKNYILSFFGVGVVKPENKRYVLGYNEGVHEYKIAFPKKRNIRQIIKVNTPQHEDVTDEIFKYMGPCHNFYDIPTTPSLLGYDEGLYLEYRNGRKIKYLPETVILLKPPSF